MNADEGKMQLSLDRDSIHVYPCDFASIAGPNLESISPPPFASVRVIRGHYTWSIPVRLFGAVNGLGR